MYVYVCPSKVDFRDSVTHHVSFVPRIYLIYSNNNLFTFLKCFLYNFFKKVNFIDNYIDELFPFRIWLLYGELTLQRTITFCYHFAQLFRL